MKKIINSTEREYQPVETQNLVLDAAPTVNSFNGVTSDAVARAIAGASGEVPQVLEGDNGKILTAVYDEGGPAVEWAEAQGGSSYTAGDGIAISAANEISTKVDGTTIQVNASGALEAIGGDGSGGVQLIPVPALNAAVAETLYGVIGNALSAGKLPVLVTTNSTNSADKRYWPLTHIENIADPSYGFNAYRFTVIEQVFNSGSSPMLFDLYQEDIIVGLNNLDGAYAATAHRYQVATAVAQASFDPFTA